MSTLAGALKNCFAVKCYKTLAGNHVSFTTKQERLHQKNAVFLNVRSFIGIERSNQNWKISAPYSVSCATRYTEPGIDHF